MKRRWSWRSTGTPGLYTFWCDGSEVGTFSMLPGHVRNESVLLVEIVELLEQAAHT